MTDRKNYPIVRIDSSLAVQSEIGAKELSHCSIASARAKLSYSDAMKWEVLPINVVSMRGEEILTLAVREELAPEKIRALRFLTDCTIKTLQCDGETLREAIFKAYQGDEHEFKSVISEPREKVPDILLKFMELAIAKEASDITIIPENAETFSAKLRIDGVLTELELGEYTKTLHSHLLNRIRVVGDLKLHTPGEPQDGALRLQLSVGERELRFHIFPTLFGEKLSIRLPKARKIPLLNELGLSLKTVNFLKMAIERLEGAVILSGPTGGGKTTTLYSVVKNLTEKELSIVSLEDPVEHNFPGVSQTEVSQLDTGSYAAGLKNVLRQDPDVILVGEVRDEESAKTALEAASTGHMLLTSVHGSSALGVIERLKRLTGDPHLVSSSVSLIVYQRLLPKLCKKCRVVNLRGARIFKANVYQAVGCVSCSHTGYAGRVLVDEALFFTSDIRHGVVEGTLRDEHLLGVPHFHTLSESVYEAIVKGDIDIKNGKKIMPL